MGDLLRAIRRASLKLPINHPVQSVLYAAHDALWSQTTAAPSPEGSVITNQEHEAVCALGREKA